MTDGRKGYPRPRTSLVALALLAASAAGCAPRHDGVRFGAGPSLPPAQGYSHVAEVPAGSRLLIVSGQVALDSTGALVGPGDFRAQTEQVFANLERALAARGATFRDVVKLTFFVADTAPLTALREVRDRYVNTAAPPTSSLIRVVGLFRPDLLIEIEAIAVLGLRQPASSPGRSRP